MIMNNILLNWQKANYECYYELHNLWNKKSSDIRSYM